ncbi:MAG: protease modulator HflC [Anaerolineaceae bacterium]|nr:protease modulator HflC [Anaerolineaceae bacterium]
MRKIIVFGVLILLVFAAIQSVYFIEEGQQGLVFQFGEPRQVVQNPGLYFKVPFIQDLVLLEKRVLGTQPLSAEYLTLDKKRLLVDHVSRWQITDPLLFYRTVRNESGAMARLDQVIAGRLREEIARHNFIDIIREKREPIMATVTDGAQQAAASFGITLIDVRIMRVDLPGEVQSSVFARMQAERERIAKRYRAEGEEQARRIRAEAEKEREIILAEAYSESQVLRGEGDAQAALVTAQAFGQGLEFYGFVRRLQVYESILGDGSTIMLPPDSDLLRYLESPIFVPPSEDGLAGN